MNLLNLIENTCDFINQCNKIQVLKCDMQLNNKQCDFSDLENKIGFKFKENIKEVYSRYKSINLVWEIEETRERGCFNLIPCDKLYSYYKEQVEISEEFIGCDEIDDLECILENIRNWIPFCTFPNGDAFCIDKRNSKVVFYEHEVFDDGINLHGLVIANSLEQLIEKWSKILFIDIYDWCEGVDEVEGIDFSKDVYKNIISITNN
jgi:hypothetical protein